MFVVMILVIAFLFSIFGFLIVPLASLGIVYLLYYMVWFVCGGFAVPHPTQLVKQTEATRPAPSTPPIKPIATAKPIPSQPLRPLSFQEWQDRQRPVLAARAWSKRWSEWTGSNLRSTACLAVISVLGYLAALAWSPSWSWSNEFLAVGTWTIVMILLSSWTVIYFAKLWETQPEDPWMYRFVMMAAGLGLGGIGYLLSEFLYVPWESVAVAKTYSNDRLLPMFYEKGSPSWPAFLTYFALLMAVVRWWRLADILRRTRFSLFGIAWPAVAAAVISGPIYFPTPWCMLVAGGTAVVVQLATRCVNSKHRQRMVAA